MGRTVIPDDPRSKMMPFQIIAVVLLVVVAFGLYWVYDVTNYGYSLTPDFMLTECDLEFREMDRYFDQIKDEYSRNGDREGAKKAARTFEREFATKSKTLTSRGANRRAEKLLGELHRFQERVD